jgi:hypothetical protein
MLASLFSRLPNAVVTPETQFKFQALQLAAEGAPVSSIAKLVRTSWRAHVWDTGIDKLMSDVDESTQPSRVIDSLVERYAELQEISSPRVWIDHTPANVRFADLLFDHYPEAQLIHVVRDPRAVFASVRSLPWGPFSAVPAAHWWLDRVAAGSAAQVRFGSERVTTVRYEDLVSRTGETMAKLSEFAGLPHIDVEQPSNYYPPQYTTRQHSLVGAPIDPSRAVKWREELSARHIRLIEQHAGSAMRYYGYELMNPNIMYEARPSFFPLIAQYSVGMFLGKLKSMENRRRRNAR